MARLVLICRLACGILVTPRTFRGPRGTRMPMRKLQIRRPSIREPETAPLPSWFGFWVGHSDMRVKRQSLEKKQQPRGSETS